MPCLSSAEAELFILVEGLKESVGVSLLLESMLQGQPPKDDYGFYQTTEGSCKIVLRTDSQAAKQISMMHGLLRGVCVCVIWNFTRHLEDLRLNLFQALKIKWQ